MESVRSVAVSIGLGIAGMDAEGYDLTNIVKSDRIKRKIVQKKWDTKKKNNPVGLVDYWGIPNRVSLNPLDYIFKFIYFVLSIPQEPNELLHERIAINKLSDRYISSKNNLTGLITVDVWMEEPELSKTVAEKFVEEIKAYVFEIEYSNLSSQESFIEKRLSDVKKDLEKNEEELKDFREKNRNISVPELILKEDRLKREVSINTQIYITLQQELELVKIKLVGQKDPIVLLDKPQLPPKKDKPKRAFIIISGALFSLMIYVIFLLFKYRNKLFE
tara:strand:- start:1727 stop:2551 length:825 start_codon:yes stop_codon:yes gene_type:complete